MSMDIYPIDNNHSIVATERTLNVSNSNAYALREELKLQETREGFAQDEIQTLNSACLELIMMSDCHTYFIERAMDISKLCMEAAMKGATKINWS